MRDIARKALEEAVKKLAREKGVKVPASIFEGSLFEIDIDNVQRELERGAKCALRDAIRAEYAPVMEAMEARLKEISEI